LEKYPSGSTPSCCPECFVPQDLAERAALKRGTLLQAKFFTLAAAPVPDLLSTL